MIFLLAVVMTALSGPDANGGSVAPVRGLYRCIKGNEESICDQELIPKLKDGKVVSISVEYVGWCGSMGPYSYGCSAQGCTDGADDGIQFTYKTSKTYHWVNQEYGFACDFKRAR
jgi:hypothetical protein